MISMISLINQEWLNQKFPDPKIYSINNFFGAQEGQFRFKAANNTNISIIRISLFDFGIPDNKMILKKTLKVTEKPLEDTMISY